MRPIQLLLLSLFTLPACEALPPRHTTAHRSAVRQPIATQPSTAAILEPKLLILHPSLETSGFYKCVLQIPVSVPINEIIGVSLHLVDSAGKKRGAIPLGVGEIIETNRWIEFSLDLELVRKSKLFFQVYPNTDQAQFVTITCGGEKALRIVDGKRVYEPIPD
jgi:hypothetical protein